MKFMEGDKLRTTVVQMDSFKAFIVVRRSNGMKNERIQQLVGVCKGMTNNEMIWSHEKSG